LRYHVAGFVEEEVSVHVVELMVDVKIKLRYQFIPESRIIKTIYEILLTQMHASLFVQLAEIRISQIFDETDGFTG
jgi:hypothetical protein